MTYTVAYEQDEDGVWMASVKQVKGCRTQGRTREEAKERIREVLSMCVDDAETALILDEVENCGCAREPHTCEFEPSGAGANTGRYTREMAAELAPKSKAGPYAIGSDHCPGLSKLAEEAGEVVQVVGKAMGAGGLVPHWDGSDLRQRLEEEMADELAAIAFVTEANQLDGYAIEQRRLQKLATFRRWHAEAQPIDPYAGRRAANAVYVPGRKQFVRWVRGVGLEANFAPAFQGLGEEFCCSCGKHVSQHFTDGRPTYFCNQDVDP